MKIARIGEFGLIEKIGKRSAQGQPSVLVGIGDDAAVLRTTPKAALLATSDMLLEGVHFDLSFTDLFSLGWKSAAVNLSDIAAMGGIPRFCLTAIALPSSLAVDSVTRFYAGFARLIGQHGAVLVGGDTCASHQGLVISVTVLGEAARHREVTRGGASPGDRIFVTNSLGDSAAGLEFLQAGHRERGQSGTTRQARTGRRGTAASLIARHLRPEPRIAWGQQLAASGCATAMIDVSDGLTSDILHICEQSGVGAVIDADAVPLSPALRAAAPYLKRPPLHYALSGGEDYELLFTVPRTRTARLRSLGLPVTEIGEVTAGKRSFIINQGKRTPLRASGFDHFSRS